MNLIDFGLGVLAGILGCIFFGAACAPMLSSQITRDEEIAAEDVFDAHTWDAYEDVLDAISWRTLVDLLRNQGWRNVTPQLVAGLCPKLAPNDVDAE